jgi:hypothetical protein
VEQKNLAMKRIRGILVSKENAAREKRVQSLRLPVIEEHPDHQPQTPPVRIAHEPPHPRKQRREQTSPATFSYFDDHELPRATNRPTRYPDKMLALPPYIVRPVDINVYRKPGHMGINPITLAGLTGSLPGALGEGKEFINSMPCHRPPNRPRPRGNPKARQSDDVTVEQVRQQSSEDLMFEMTYLRTRCMQAVLDGDAIDDSSVGTHNAPEVLSRFPEPAPQEKYHLSAGDDAEWVDTSDDEDGFKGEKAPGINRKDSGYSTGDAHSIPQQGRAEQRVVWNSGKPLEPTKEG